MAREVIKKVGVFENDTVNQLNLNFSELYAAAVGGAITDGGVTVPAGIDAVLVIPAVGTLTIVKGRVTGFV